VAAPLSSRFTDRALVSRAVIEADYLISLPKLKTHCLTLITAGVKNMYGILVGAEKARFHYLGRTKEGFSELLVDVFAVRPPDLTIIDAVCAMEGDGPSQGTLRRLSLILAGDNAVATDAVAARLLGVPAENVRHLALAAARGLGILDERRIELDGRFEAVRGFRLPSNFSLGLMSALSNRLVFNIFRRSRLRINPRLCTRCGECRRACPFGAILIRGSSFGIRKSLCRSCFCCQEVCPAGAVKVHGALGTYRRLREIVR
jgi:ferredoxin